MWFEIWSEQAILLRTVDPCQKLFQMRTEATALNIRLKEQHTRIRLGLKNERRDDPRPTSDLALYLQRKLLRIGSKIDEHISQHNCQA